MKAYINENYEQALIETFLKFDDLLKSEKVNSLLKKFHKTQFSLDFEFDLKISIDILKEENFSSEIKNNLMDFSINEENLISKEPFGNY